MWSGADKLGHNDKNVWYESVLAEIKSKMLANLNDRKLRSLVCAVIKLQAHFMNVSKSYFLFKISCSVPTLCTDTASILPSFPNN